MSSVLPVPIFSLYGEPPEGGDCQVTHVEPLALRSEPASWRIRTHMHRDLAQLFLIDTGAGTMFAEGRNHAFDTPALLVVPAGTMHGFAWEAGTTGQVLTVGRTTLAAVRTRLPELDLVFASPRIVAFPDGRSRARMRQILDELAAETSWGAPRHAVAVEALLLLAMVAASRMVLPGGAVAARDIALTGRFRNLVDTSFRARLTIPDYARRLGVSERRLREACARTAAQTPVQMALERAMLEARRMLGASTLTAAEIGYALGFEDPAYFSRMFRKHTGRSPISFRQLTR